MSDIVELKKNKKETNRRWFSSLNIDLIIFYSDNGSKEGFQFCYDKNKDEQMISWSNKNGYSHMAIDDGESFPGQGYKRTPLIVPNGLYDLNSIYTNLVNIIEKLPRDISDFVLGKIQEHPRYVVSKNT